jgi:hypothetical protein
MVKCAVVLLPALLLVALMTTEPAVARAPASTFGDDLAFLQQHVKVVVLHDAAKQAQVAVVPAWQGHVMTSTAAGPAGASFGWVNRALISAGARQPHINVFGGEDRFWLGPEGGQFSIFFAKGAAFDLEHWFTPAAIDTMAYNVVRQSPDAVTVEASFPITNYSGSHFDVRVVREVRLLAANDAWARLGVGALRGVSLVAFESDNRITNAGREAWRKETGLLSIWILGMFNPAPDTTIVVPIVAGAESKLGTKVTSNYFGDVPPERLIVGDRAAFFKADGQFRSKIGVSPQRSRGVLGSYDAASRVLTIVQFTQPPGVTDYVNSQWKLQDSPYAGDAANAYNDGPPSPGAKPLGPFYELESSSPAAALAPGASASHVHRTIHLRGGEKDLDAVARAVLGVSLEAITSALKAGPTPPSR